MTAVAAAKPLSVRSRPHRRSAMPTCTVCAASMIAAEASVLGPGDVVSYLWSCDVCGYGFVTDHDAGHAAKPSRN